MISNISQDPRTPYNPYYSSFKKSQKIKMNEPSLCSLFFTVVRSKVISSYYSHKKKFTTLMQYDQYRKTNNVN